MVWRCVLTTTKSVTGLIQEGTYLLQSESLGGSTVKLPTYRYASAESGLL